MGQHTHITEMTKNLKTLRINVLTLSQVLTKVRNDLK